MKKHWMGIVGTLVALSSAASASVLPKPDTNRLLTSLNRINPELAKLSSCPQCYAAAQAEAIPSTASSYPELSKLCSAQRASENGTELKLAAWMPTTMSSVALLIDCGKSASSPLVPYLVHETLGEDLLPKETSRERVIRSHVAIERKAAPELIIAIETEGQKGARSRYLERIVLKLDASLQPVIDGSFRGAISDNDKEGKGLDPISGGYFSRTTPGGKTEASARSAFDSLYLMSPALALSWKSNQWPTYDDLEKHPDSDKDGMDDRRVRFTDSVEELGKLLQESGKSGAKPFSAEERKSLDEEARKAIKASEQ